MKYEFVRLMDELRDAAAYQIFKDCMFQPTPEKYAARLEALADARFYGCLENGRLLGIIGVSLRGGGEAEIAALSVAPERRRQGVGRWLIAEAARAEDLTRLPAETDADAVGFYRRCGFRTTEIQRVYDGQPVARWTCEWRKWGQCVFSDIDPRL